MIIVGFVGDSVPEGILSDLSTQNLAGIVLDTTNRNFKSPEQIRRVTADIRNAAATPPFIAIDQEGGKIGRLNASNGFAETSTPHELGTVLASLDATRAQASLMASWLQSCGFNVNLAPVADVDVNPSCPTIGFRGRSFSADPMVVAAHNRVFVDEFHARNIITTLKHFPGHGSAGTDSHLTLPDITKSWSDKELTPYRELLKTKSVDMIMVGHLFNASFDDVLPSSLSRATIQGLLRDSLHFDGVTISDDLHDMKAISDHYGFGEAAELAVNAGTDILMYATNDLNSGSLCRWLIDTLEAKVRDGIIAEKRIDEAYERILRLKMKYGIIRT